VAADAADIHLALLDDMAHAAIETSRTPHSALASGPVNPARRLDSYLRTNSSDRRAQRRRSSDPTLMLDISARIALTFGSFAPLRPRIHSSACSQCARACCRLPRLLSSW